MSLLEPASVVVVGASAQEGKVGHAIVRNLCTQGYRGAVFAVNPKHDSILGVPCFPSVAALPATPECAVIAVPAASVSEVLHQCGERGITTVIVISAGFRETGKPEGEAMERELAAIAVRHRMTLIGPNCLGILRPPINLNASFARAMPPNGKIALVSQSGAFAVALLDGARTQGLGFSAILSIGNVAAFTEADAMRLLLDDPETTAIGLYLESIADGELFLSAAHALQRRKPVVLLKAGASRAGARAAASHTGALAGSEGALTAACASSGIRRVRTLGEFVDSLIVLSSQPPLLSPRIAVITNAGGPGILAADAAESAGLTLDPLTSDRAAALRVVLPDAASTRNPIDLLGDADASRFTAALAACGEDPGVDGIIVLLTPQEMTPATEIARHVAAARKRFPLMPIVASFMGEESVTDARTILADANVPHYPTPERAAAALAALRQVHHPLMQECPHTSLTTTAARTRAAAAQSLLVDKHGLLIEDDARALLALYDLPMPPQAIARSAEEAGALATQIGFPVIAKVSAPTILHKTDVGGIRANIKSAEGAREAFAQITTSVRERAPDAMIRGVLIQRFLRIGDEFILGGLRDRTFGPVVMAGLGGVYTELFRDTAFRLAPVAEEDAYTMLQSLNAWKVLLGMRGKPQSDIAALAQAISSVGTMLCENPQIREFDMNPVLVTPLGIAVADAKVILD